MRNSVCAALVAAAAVAPRAQAGEWLYYIGGIDLGGAAHTDVNFIEILPGGILNGGWSALPNVPSPGVEITACSIGGDIVVAYGGGCLGCAGACVSDVYFATVDPANGTIAGWTSTTALPFSSYQPRMQLDSSGSYLYVVSPNSNQCCAGAYTPGVGVSSWALQPAPGPGIEFDMGGDGASLFVTSGFTIGAATYASSISGGSIGGWAATTSAPASQSGGQLVCTSGYAYLFGGGTATVNSASISGTTLGSWTSVGALPSVMSEHDVVYSNTGYFFLVNGCPSLCPCAPWSSAYSAPNTGGGGIGGWSGQVPHPGERYEGGAVIVEAIVTVSPSPSPTQTRTRTRTPTRTPTPGNAATPIPTPTCPIAYASATPPFLLVDKNVFDPEVEYLQIVWAVAGAGNVQVSIYNSAGEFIRRLELGRCGTGGQLYHAVWDGKNFQDRLVSSNVYVLRLVTLGAKDAIVRRVAVQR